MLRLKKSLVRFKRSKSVADLLLSTTPCQALNLLVTPVPQRWVSDANSRSNSTPPKADPPSQTTLMHNPKKKAMGLKWHLCTMCTIIKKSRLGARIGHSGSHS